MSITPNPIEQLRFKTVFISYSTKDENLALEFVKRMEALGCECWIACQKVRPGNEWDYEVIQALKKLPPASAQNSLQPQPK